MTTSFMCRLPAKCSTLWCSSSIMKRGDELSTSFTESNRRQTIWAQAVDLKKLSLHKDVEYGHYKRRRLLHFRVMQRDRAGRSTLSRFRGVYPVLI